MSEDSIWWKFHADTFKYAKTDGALTAAIRKIHPGAPEVLSEHTTDLLSGKGVAVVDGEGGTRLTLTRGDSTFEGGLHYEFHVVCEGDGHEAGDYGLAEFDRIMLSLGHSAPVAAAIKSIQQEEANLPPLTRPQS